MKTEDKIIVETVFNEYCKFDYSPIVLCSTNETVHKFIEGMLHSHQIRIIQCDMKDIELDDVDDIAITNVEKSISSIDSQTALVKVLDSQKEKHHTIFLTTHCKVNDLNLMGRLRARLLSGVYIEI